MTKLLGSYVSYWVGATDPFFDKFVHELSLGDDPTNRPVCLFNWILSEALRQHFIPDLAYLGISIQKDCLLQI